MGAVSYPDEKVAAFISSSVIPLQLQYDAKPFAERFRVKWTPALFVLDGTGVAHHAAVGFLPPEELIPFLQLGMAKIHINWDDPAGALPHLEELIAGYGQSGPAPEAVYYRGVCRFKTSKDPADLKSAYEELRDRYQQSEWHKRALPYRLL